MKLPRGNHAILACLIITVVTASQGLSQDSAGVDGIDPNLRVPQDNIWIDLHNKFEKMDDPPLSMGDTGERVRELQKTLNRKLGGQPRIELRPPIFVGPAVGPPGTKLKEQLRLVYSYRQDVAFQVRGDWVPFDEGGGRLEMTTLEGSKMATL